MKASDVDEIHILYGVVLSILCSISAMRKSDRFQFQILRPQGYHHYQILFKFIQ
jgi:hypothetical protein